MEKYKIFSNQATSWCMYIFLKMLSSVKWMCVLMYMCAHVCIGVHAYVCVWTYEQHNEEYLIVFW